MRAGVRVACALGVGRVRGALNGIAGADGTWREMVIVDLDNGTTAVLESRTLGPVTMVPVQLETPAEVEA